MISEHIKEIARLWPEYSKNRRTNKDSRIHDLVIRQIPSLLASWLDNEEKFLCEGSEGQGNLLRAPWIAAFNRSVTESAQNGYYVVLLFSEDMQNLTLAIGFGATQFKNQFGTGENFFLQVDRAVVNMRINSQHLLKSHLEHTLPLTNSQEVRLDNSGNFLLKAYEKCSIYSVTYKIQDLQDSILKKDFLEYISLYNSMVESLLLADVNDYVLEQIEVPKNNFDLEIKRFQPRLRKSKNKTQNSVNSKSGNRKSKRSDKIGQIGEEWVYNFEVRKLKNLGKNDLSEKVIWHRNYPEDRTPGWDITSFDENGAKILIEVKSSEGKVINDFILTSKEWDKAKSNLSPIYYVYLVTNVLTTPLIEVIHNPYSYVLQNILDIQIESYSLSLYSK